MQFCFRRYDIKITATPKFFLPKLSDLASIRLLFRKIKELGYQELEGRRARNEKDGKPLLKCLQERHLSCCLIGYPLFLLMLCFSVMAHQIKSQAIRLSFVDGFKFLATIGINHKNFTSVKRATTKSNNIKQFCFYINDTAAQQRQK